MIHLPYTRITICLAAVITAGSVRADLAGFNNGSGWSLNGSPTPAATSNTLDLGQGIYGGASSAFNNTAQSVSSWTASFLFVDNGPFSGGLNDPGDGFVFALQDAGPGAVGFGGGDLGYVGISNATGVAFDFWTAGGPGTGLANTSIPYNYTSTGGVNLRSSDPIWASLSYSGGTLTENLTDLANSDVYSTSYAVDIPSLVGSDWAYVGFTDGTGGATHDVVISDFTFSTRVPDSGSAAWLAVFALAGLAAVRRWSASSQGA